MTIDTTNVRERFEAAIERQILQTLESDEPVDATLINAAIRWYTTRFGMPKSAKAAEEDQQTVEEVLMGALTRGIDASRLAQEARVEDDGTED